MKTENKETNRKDSEGNKKNGEQETTDSMKTAPKTASHHNQNNTEDIDYTNDELLARLTNSIDKTSLRGLVKSFCLIERQEEDTIFFVVLQKIQLGILQKQENLKSIEDALSEILGRRVNAAMRYQSKDEYFSSLL